MVTQRDESAASGRPGGAPVDPAWAWASYEPGARPPGDRRWAGHLFRRAGFGATAGELARAEADGPQRTIDRLLAPGGDIAAFNATYDKHETRGGDAASAESLRGWWLHRMLQTTHPLLEKMVLFWHGHFATSSARVKSAASMQRHAALLRRHALGRFDELLRDVTRDPALLVGLEGGSNRKAFPSEHFAREYLEALTLGAGNFTENDVKEAARAFTGWFVERRDFRFIPREHDDGVKEFRGKRGSWTGDDVVRIVLEERSTPRLVVRRLYRWLIAETEEPRDELLAPLAERFAADYDIAKLVERMLRSNLFFSGAAYRRRVKSPVEFAVGIVRGLEGLVPTAPLGDDLAALGQSLYYPPTVKGWAGGTAWITNGTMAGRSNLALALLGGPGPYGERLDPAAIAAKHGFAEPERAGSFLIDLFMQGDLEPAVREAILAELGAADGAVPAVRRFARALFAAPEFQLA